MQSKPWKLPKIGSRDLAWLAGLLEGEASFSLQHYHHGGSLWYLLPSIEVKMTDRDVICRVGGLLGGGQQRVRSFRPKKASWKRVFIWRVNGRRAVHVMKQLLPHMGKRRSKRISQLVADYERDHRASRVARGIRYRVSEARNRKYHRNYLRMWRKRRRAKGLA
jgi:hypothetical protein